MPKNWHFQTVVLEKTPESPLDRREIKPVNPEGNQPWIFSEMTNAEAEAPILRPPDAKCWLTGRDPDAGKNWGQEEKGATEDEMVGWHLWLSGMSLSKLRERWRTRKPGVLQLMGLQRVRHDWATEQQQMFKFKLNYKILIMFVRTQSIWNIRFSERCKEKRKEGC